MAYYQPPMAFQPPANDPCRAWFDAVDVDRSGYVSPPELTQCLQRAGHNFSVEICAKMIRMFDRDGSGQISFMEFQQLFAFLNGMIAGFRARDRDGSGRLDGGEVRIALQQSGYQLAEPTFQLMMRKFDRAQQGSLDLNGYTELSVALGTARNVFSFYDRSRTGQVTFTFDTFTTASMSMMV